MHRFFALGVAITLLTALLLSSCGTSTPTLVVKGAISARRDARGTGSPTRFDLKLYAAYLTTNADCSGPYVTVADNGTAGTTFDMVSGPTILSASPAAATYKCFILRMSDVMTFRPDAAAAAAFPGTCSTSADATFDIYRAGEVPQWKDKEGNSITPLGDASSPTESSTTISGAAVPGVTIFATTDTAAAIATGISSNQTISLTSDVTVTTTTSTLTLITNFQNQITTSGSGPTYCWMDAGTLTIQ